MLYSQLEKVAFRNFQQKPEQKVQFFNEDSLSDDGLIDFLFNKLFQSIDVSTEFDWNLAFPQDNIQTNSKSVDAQFMKKMFNQKVHEDIMSGFTTSEHTIKLLQESSYSTFFRVQTNSDTLKFTRQQQTKFLILFGLFLTKGEKQGASGQTFFEFIENFLKENISSQDIRSIVGLNTGLKFSLTILKELYKIKSDILLSALLNLYEALKDAPAGSIFGSDQSSFQQDQTLNELRAFLVSVMQNASTGKDLLEIAAKILFRLGIIRSNPEDLITLIKVLNEKSQLADQLDLRDEIRSLPQVTQTSKTAQKDTKDNLTTSVRGILNSSLLFLKSSDRNQIFSLQNDAVCSFACDGQHIYHAGPDQKIKKINIPKQPNETLYLKEETEFQGVDKNFSLCYVAGNLLARMPGENPIKVIDSETLKEDTKLTESLSVLKSEKSDSLHFSDQADPETGRLLGASPLFTDGNFVYVVSQKKYIAPADADEDHQSLPTALVVEKYNSTNFTHVISVTLFENEQHDYFQCQQISKDEDQLEQFVLKSTWHTNGENLLVCFKENRYLFSLTTGVKTFQGTNYDYSDESIFIHDTINGRLLVIEYKPETELQTLQDCKMDQILKLKQNNSSDVVSISHESFIDKLKLQYFNNEVKSQSLNLFQKLMFQSKQDTQTLTPLPKNSFKHASLFILDHIRANCEQFDSFFKIVESEGNPKQENYINIFKFPNATYLTGDLFSILAELIQQKQHLIQEVKSESSLEEHISYFYLLKILSSNLRSLSFCGIDLPQIMTEHNYQAFLNTYNVNIVSLIEKGYNNTFEGNKASLLQQIWQQIYKVCQEILTDSMQLIYSDTAQVVQNVIKILDLPDLNNKQSENCSFSLQYLATQQNVNKILKVSNLEQQQNLKQLLQKLIHIKVKKSAEIVKSYAILSTEKQTQPKQDIFDVASDQLIDTIAKSVLRYTETLNQSLQKKIISKSEEAKAKRIAEEDQFNFSISIICLLFQMFAQKLQEEIQIVKDHLVDTLGSLQKDEINEEFAKKTQAYTNKISSLVLLPQNINIVNLFITGLPIICTTQFKLAGVMTSNIISLAKQIYSLILVLTDNKNKIEGKQEPEDSDDEQDTEQSKIVKQLSLLGRKICWFVGFISFGLVQVKTVVPTVEDSKKETQQQKMERMLMDSQLLSGGVESKFVAQFTSETKQKVQEIISLTLDQSLSEILSSDNQNKNNDYGIFGEIITEGKNKFSDLLVKVLQISIEMQSPPVTYAKQGGEDGLKLTRAAFAVMTKYAQMTQKLENMINEVDMYDSDFDNQLDERSKVKQLRDSLQNENDFQDLLKLWNQASRMRLWIAEKKKNLSDKIEKQCREKFVRELAEKKKQQKAVQIDQVEGEQKQEAKPDLEVKQSVEVQIDTNAELKVPEEQKEADADQSKQEEDDEVKLTEDDKLQLQQIIDLQFDKELKSIYEKIMEKAEYLLQTQVPTAYQQLSKEKSIARMISASNQFAEEQELINKLDWKERLKHWKTMQQDQGSIKTDAKLKSEILDSGSMSVLACLQSPINVKKIQQRVESEYLKGLKRVAGLKLLAQLFRLPIDQLVCEDLKNWFTSALRDKTNNLTHYLSNITGCGSNLEIQVREQFFSIIKSIIEQIKASRSKEQIIYLLDALRWQFWGRDHSSLTELNIFKVLRYGDGHRKHPIRFAWGKAVEQKVLEVEEQPSDLTREILITFENLYFNLVSRIVEDDHGAQMQLKTSGTSIPVLEKRKSVISVGQTENLIGSAFDILFKELDRFEQLFKKFEGIDYFTFVRYQNKFKSYKSQDKEIENLMEKFNDELLLDIYLEDKQLQKDKTKLVEEKSKSEEQENQQIQDESDQKQQIDEISLQIETQIEKQSDLQEAEISEQNENTDKKGTETDQNTTTEEELSKDKDDFNQDNLDNEDKKLAETEEKEKKTNEAFDFTKQQLQKLTDEQFQMIKRLYDGNFLTRLLRMIEIFTTVAQTQAKPMEMVQKVANPYVLNTLINLFVCGQPRNQMIILKIIQSLIFINIPTEIFEAAMKLVAQNQKLQAIYNQKSFTMFNSDFIDFWFKVLLDFRSTLWDRTKLKSDDSYEISQEISFLINSILTSNKSYYDGWCNDIKDKLSFSLLNIEVLSQAEKDVIFSLQIGADFKRISIGSQVITSSNQLLTVLGFADKEQDAPLKVQSNFINEKQDLLGLYYDEVSKERQEIIRVMPYNLKSVQGLNNQDIEQQAKRSALLQPDVLKHLVQLLVIKDTKEELKLQILKSITCMFTILQKQFLHLLEENDLLTTIIKFLLQQQKIQTKSINTIVPVTWLEAKATNMRVAALENDVSLAIENEINAQIFNNKQIIVTSKNIEQNTKFAQSVYLISAINLHLLESGQLYQCAFNLNENIRTLSSIRQGFIFIESERLQKLDEAVLQLMSESFAIITHDVQVRELYLEIVSRARTSIEADDESGKQWGQVLNCAVLVIAKEDYDELRTNFDNKQQATSQQEQVSEIDFLMRQLQDWGGFKTQSIIYHISQLEDRSISNINANLIEIIKKVTEEQKQHDDAIAKLKSEKQSIQPELEKLQKVTSERAEKVEKVMSEDSLSNLVKVKSVIEMLVEKSESTVLKSEFAFPYDQNKSEFKELEKIIQEEFVQNKDLAQKKSAKSEEAMCKLYLKELSDFSLPTLAADYKNVVSKLLDSYYKDTLLQILISCDLSVILPTIGSSKELTKQLACYFKSSFNQAWLTKNQTGQKTELNTVKNLLRKIISFCLNSNVPDLKKFVHQFLQDDVLDAGLKTVKLLKTEKVKSIADFFAKEDTAIEYLHPNFLAQIVKILLECRFDVLLQSQSYIPTLFTMLFSMFVRFWTSGDGRTQIKLLETSLCLIFFTQEYIDALLSVNVVQALVNIPLLNYIVRQIDYTQQSFSEVQKLLLEVYLGMIGLKEIAELKIGKKLDSSLVMTLGISQAQRALKIVKEKASFQFLKYFIHESKLQDHDRQLMNQNFGTQDPHFDVKTLAKFSIDQVQRIQIKAHENCEFKPFTFLGLSQSPTGENMTYYTVEDLKEANDADVNLNYSQFYTFYPLKKQLLIAMGENKHYRMTEMTIGDLPKAVELDFVPKQVSASKNSTFLLSNDNELYTVGEKSGQNYSQFTKIALPKNEIPSKIFCGSRIKFVIAQSGKVFYVGEPRDFELPNNSSSSSFKELKIFSDDTNQENIVDISCGNNFNLYVTNKGRVWASGKQFLKKLGIESENAVPLHISSDPGIQVCKAWASQSKDQQIALIQTKLPSGQLQYLSVGKNEQGLLGQGGKIKDTKQFGKIAIDFDKISFVEVSMQKDHAVAIDQDGLLWAWGSNLQQRSGLSEEIDCVFQPTKVAAFEQLHLQAIRISCGVDHTLVLARNIFTDKVYLYSIGKDENNFKALGVTKQIAGETVIRQIQQLEDFEIVDFCASSKFNMVIIGGDKNPCDNLYEHLLPSGQKVQGVLHAYKKDNKWQFMSQNEYYESSGDNLPDVSLAFKCPIENIEEVFNGEESIFNFNIEETLVDDQQTDLAHSNSSVSEKPIKNKVAYYAETLINGDQVHICLTEDEYLKNQTQFDVHPLIYFRLKKPLAEGQKLPLIDLSKIYKVTNKFGFRFEITPDLSFIENEKLIQQTQHEYDEYVELSKKFPIQGDSELIMQMSRYLEKQQSFDILKDDAEKIFKVNELSFKADGKLYKVSEQLLKQRIQLYWQFNRSFVQSFPYLLNSPPKGFVGQKVANTSAASLFQDVKSMILTSVKLKFVDDAIKNLPEFGDRHEVTISRNDALRFQETGKVDHTAEHSIFGQILQCLKLSTVKYEPWQQNNVDNQALRVEFEGESAIDAGGPYRETLTNMALEIESAVLPLMLKSPNNRNNHGDNRDCFVVNHNSKTPTHEEMFKFQGVLIGYAFRSKSCMPFNYAPVFWKQLVGEEVNESDLKSFDTYSWQIIQDLRKHAKTIKSQEEFEQVVDQQFITTLNCGQEIELCENGHKRNVNQQNVEEFIRLLIDARFSEGHQQMKWIQEGMSIIVPKSIVNILSWEEVEVRAAGSKTTDVEKLKSITEYRNCSENSKVVKMFWNVMSRMSEEDKTLYLKFVWGRQRLPQDCSDLRYNHRIALIDYWDKEALPESHTCFFAIDIPDYQSEEILEKKLLTSIRFCGEIDND